jgi:2-hydroxycyclohexanecarboxyl-CoA dehydrogenase
MPDPTGFVVRELSESSVLIVGGTSGIGLAAAHAFASAGAPQIAVIGRDERRGAEARDAVRGAAPGVDVAFFSADATVPEQAQRAAEAARARAGRIDVLITATTSRDSCTRFRSRMSRACCPRRQRDRC